MISFRSALARSVVSSTRDAELLAALHCTYRVSAHRLFLAEIGLQQPAATPTGSDAMAVIQGVSIRVVHRDFRWNAIRFAFIKQAILMFMVGDESSSLSFSLIINFLSVWPKDMRGRSMTRDDGHHDVSSILGRRSLSILVIWPAHRRNRLSR